MSLRLAAKVASFVSLAALSSAQWEFGVNRGLDTAAVNPPKPLHLWEKYIPENEKIAKSEHETVSSVLGVMHDTIRTRMSRPDDQLTNAWVAFIIGLMLLVVDCRAIFKWFGVVAAAVFAGLLSMNEVKARWTLGYENGAGPVIGLEAALLAGYAALRGFSGLMILVGAFVGWLLAHMFSSFLSHVGFLTFEIDKAPIVIWYSVFMLGSVFMTIEKTHVPLLAFATPLLGGALVSSAVFWFATGMLSAGTPAPWVDFLLMLSSGDNQDVGMNAGSGNHQDRLQGCAVWFLLFCLGSFRQLMILKKPAVAPAAAK